MFDRRVADGPFRLAADRLRSLAMTGVGYALMGLLGGFLVEAVEWQAAIRRTRTFPWRAKGEPPFGPMLLAVLLRLAAGAGLAFAAGIGEQVNGPFGALAVGIAAPLIVEKLASQVPSGIPVPMSDANDPLPLRGEPTQTRSVDPQPPARQIGAGG